MKIITMATTKRNELIDITPQVNNIIAESKVKDGICLVYVPHATAAITINENADPNIADDFLKVLGKMVPEHDNYEHDKIDGNAAAHIKASIIGPSEAIPMENGQLALGRWQDIFLCEFDGPRQRKVYIQIVEQK